MMKVLKAFSIALVGAGLLAMPSLAQAQEFTLRLEPGVAAPLTKPQSDRFGAGGAVAVKPELTLGHYVGLGPSISYVALYSRVPGVDTGTGLSLGGFLRVKRPHDELNTGTGLSAVSPWVDADAQYVRTDPLDRFSWSAAVGAAVPTSDARNIWVGPFVRYTNVHEAFDKPRTNTDDANILIVGLSVELGPKAKQKEAPVPPPVVPPPAPLPPPEEPKKVDPLPPPPPAEIVRFQPRIQFAWDSAVLDAAQTAVLADVVKSLLADKTYSVRIEGHASSEGQVEHNNKLSQRRADSVRNFLIANGVDGSRLTATGFGSRVPVADNKTEEGRIQNRRVEFDVSFVLVRQPN